MNRRNSLCAGLLAAVVASGAASFAAPSFAEMTVMVGGAPMYPSKNIVQNAVNSKDHTTLVAAVKAAGLVETLEGPGPFTVFAPTNEAFARLPKGTVETLLKPENHDKLVAVLTYHVVPDERARPRRQSRPGRRQGHAQDGRGRGPDREAARPLASYRHRRQGRHGRDHHSQRLPVERRDPCDQQGSDPGLTRP